MISFLNKVIVLFMVCALASPCMAAKYPSYDKPVHVNPYTKKDGTYVDGHWRSKPNSDWSYGRPSRKGYY